MRRNNLRRMARSRPESLEIRRLLSTLIAEVDTGVDLNSVADAPYYDLANGYNAYTQQPATADGSNIADNSLGGGHGHGSTVADSIIQGIVAAKQQPGAGNADVKILPIRVTTNSGTTDSGTFNAVLRGIFYAAYHHARVINVSFVFTERVDNPGYVPNNPDASYTNVFPTFQNAIDYANSKGAVVVTGAGNNHYNIDSTDPSVNGYLPYRLFPTSNTGPNLIVAASTDSNNNLTSVSNYGPVHVTVGAPAIQDATSYAAGYSSGVAGVLAALNPSLSAKQVVDVIESTVQKSPGLTNLIKTGGVINPAAAVKAILGQPTVASPASATPSTVTGTSSVLSALGADNAGESGLTYRWSVVDGLGVTFSPSSNNGTNAGKTITANFTRAGTYTFRVTIANANGKTTTSDVNATVSQTATSLTIAPTSAQVADGGTQAFSATAYDQFGATISPQPAIAWSVGAGGVGGTIDATGKYTAPGSGSGTDTVQAKVGTITKSAQVTVTSTSQPSPGIAIGAGTSTAHGSYSADMDYSGGNLYSTSSPVDTGGVTDPAPQAVYQSQRWTGGSFSYSIPGLVPGATYAVRLHFAEVYYSSPGQRLFNVSINGAPALTNFDIAAAAGGANKAVVESFSATADSSGRISITFTNVKGGAEVSGIQVIPQTA